MFVICANTIEEAERDLQAMKQAVATGKPIGCGGDTVEDVEQAMECLRNALSAQGECCHYGCKTKDGWIYTECDGMRLKLPCDKEDDYGCCPEADDCYDEDEPYCDGCCCNCDYAGECEDYGDENERCEDCNNCEHHCEAYDREASIRGLLEKIVNHLNS